MVDGLGDVDVDVGVGVGVDGDAPRSEAGGDGGGDTARGGGGRRPAAGGGGGGGGSDKDNTTMPAAAAAATPLCLVATPALDAVASGGLNGLCDPVRPGLACGSDTAHLSMLGYAPAQYYRGRGAFESLGAGLTMAPGEIAFKVGHAHAHTRARAHARAESCSEGGGAPRAFLRRARCVASSGCCCVGSARGGGRVSRVAGIAAVWPSCASV